MTIYNNMRVHTWVQIVLLSIFIHTNNSIFKTTYVLLKYVIYFRDDIVIENKIFNYIILRKNTIKLKRSTII